jgi:hypothetical protein
MWRLFKSLWFYLGIYTVLVLLFAIAFTVMPGQFYHSTTAYEPETRIYKYEVQDNLMRDVRRNISPDSGDRTIIRSWNVTTILIADLVLQDDWLVAKALIYGIDASRGRRFQATFNLRISKVAISTPMFKPERDEKGAITAVKNDPIYEVHKIEVADLDMRVEPKPAEQSDAPDVSELFPCRSYRGYAQGCIEADKNADERLKMLVKLLSGQPESGWDNFFRMLYFSVITVTTVGFGDIVPVTRFARALVTLEAFLGPVVLGFFLSAIGSKIAGPRNEMTVNSTVPPSTEKRQRRRSR